MSLKKFIEKEIINTHEKLQDIKDDIIVCGKNKDNELNLAVEEARLNLLTTINDICKSRDRY